MFKSKSRKVAEFDQYLRALYRGLPARAVDDAELNSWSRRLMAGTAPLDVVDAFHALGEPLRLAEFERFLGALYRREPSRTLEGSSLAMWVRRMAAGVAPSEVVDAFYASGEPLRAAEFERLIKALYRGLLGREADEAGSKLWVQQMLGGAPPSLVVEAFMSSDEYLRRAEHLSIKHFERFLRALYSGLLHREPDDARLASWIARMSNGTTPAEVVETLNLSDEVVRWSRSRSTDEFERFLRALYKGLLQREPDDAGFSFWIAQMSNGTTAAEVVETFVLSDEVVRWSRSRSTDQFERFLRALYKGLLQREPDDAGFSFWIAQMSIGTTAAEVVETFNLAVAAERGHDAKLFAPPGHFYSPIVDTVEADRHLRRIESQGLPLSLPDVALDRTVVVRKWHELLPFMTSSPFSADAGGGLRYGFENHSYSWGDGSVLHAMLRLHRPKKLIEIGSGYSSACIFDTVERYLDGNCQLTHIEPYPQLLNQLLGDDASRVRIMNHCVQDVSLELFDELDSGDILFIDSTHVLRTGSDVCFELFEILPRLKKGVLVHFHDMFWPFEYPRTWAVDENRSWNELYAVRAFLMGNDAWEIVMFNDYLAAIERPMIAATYPAFLRNIGGALWLQRR